MTAHLININTRHPWAKFVGYEGGGMSHMVILGAYAGVYPPITRIQPCSPSEATPEKAAL